MPTDYDAWPDWTNRLRWTIPEGHLTTTDDATERTPCRRPTVRDLILKALAASGKPLAAKAIVALAGLSPRSSQPRTVLASLVREGLAKVTEDGYVLLP